MPCPTCDHTLDSLGRQADIVDDVRYWHCPRCGTLVFESDIPGHKREVYPPKLVDRCRRLAKDCPEIAYSAAWRRLGIAEAINTPDNRPR